MLIDTHCHLTDSKIEDVKKTIELAKMAGVEQMFIQPTDMEDSKRAVLVAEQEKLYAVVGVQPEFVDTVTDINTLIYQIEELVEKSSRVIGIGEIGLDFYWDREKKTKTKQIEVFRAQMEVAVRLKLPVVIHMREAEEEMLSVLNSMEKVPSGEFHCFGGGEEFLKRVLEKGFYIGFAGNVTFKSAGELRRMLTFVPPNRLLLETDSPYLSPEPLRGRVNSPANVKIIATAVAKELNIETEKLIEQTGKNALCLFSLDI